MAKMNNKNKQLPAVNYISHPLTSEGSKRVTVESGVTISQVLKNINYPVHEFDGVMVWVNGKPIENFETHYVYDGDIVNVRPVMKGKDTGMILATIVTIVISIYFPPAAAAIGMGTLATGIVAAGLIYAATKVIYSAFPPPAPQEIERKESYLLGGTRNRTRQFECLPLVIGKLRVAPDTANSPFGTFQDGDQIVLQVFHFGLQRGLKLSDFRIGDTPIEKFTTPPKIYHPDASGALPDIFNDTEVIQGLEVKNATGKFVVTTSPGAIKISIDVQIVAYDVDDDGDVSSESIDVLIQVFNKTTDTLIFGKQESIAGDLVNEVRKTFSTGILPSAQYRVEITKVSGDKNSSSGQRQLHVVGIKATQEDNTDYSYQQRVGVSMKASGQLSGVVNQLTAFAADEIPVFKNGVWAIEETENPAWWLLWWLRGKRTTAGQLLYGGGLHDGQIDIESIKRFGEWCTRKNLTVSLYLNKESTVKHVANVIARCGRGEITFGSGRAGVIWDDDQLVPVAVFGPANIRANTFKVNYNADKTADEVIVNFLNKDKDYKPDSVRVPVGNTQSPERPIQFQFEGCTNADMAGREARLIAAAQELMRRSITWETDIEGIVAKRGDVVLLSHDMIGWSESGRVVAGIDRQSFYIDKDINFTAKGYIGIRTPDGKYESFKLQSVNGREVVLQVQPPVNFKMPGETNSPAADWMWFYDEGGKPGKTVKIVDVQVKDKNTLSFVAKDYLPNYYQAESGDYVHVTPSDPSVPFNGVIPGVLAWETYRIQGEVKTQVLAISWIPSGSVNQYSVSIWNDKSGGEQQATTTASGVRFDVAPGRYNYRITGTDSLTGEIYSAVGSIDITGSADIAPVKEFRAAGVLGGIILDWRYPDNPLNMRKVLIRATYTDVKTKQGVIENFELAYPINRFVHNGLGVAQRVNYELTLVDAEGNTSKPVAVEGMSSDNIDQIIDAIAGEIDESALAQDLQQKIDKVGDVETGLNNLKDSVDADFKKVRDDLANAESTLTGAIKTTNDQVSKLNTGLTAASREIEAAKLAAQTGVNEAKAQISTVSTSLTRSITDANAEVNQVKQDLAAALQQEAQNNANIKSELSALIAKSGVQTFSQQTEPKGDNIKAGDIWFKEDANGKVLETFRYDGNAWHSGGAADAKANAAAIMREQTARADADTALGQRIDTVSASTINNAAAIRQQETAMAKANAALAESINQVSTKANKNASDITTERAARSDADTALGKRIDSVNAEVGKVRASVTNEATARASAVEALSNSINALTATANQNKANISSEASTRATQTEALGRRIDQVVTKSNQNAAAISSEATTRAAADGALGIRIDQVKASAKATDDKTGQLDAAIKAEQVARADGDKALGLRVDTVTASVSNIDRRFDNFDFEDGLKNWSTANSGKTGPDITGNDYSIAKEAGEGQVLQISNGHGVFYGKAIKVDTSRKYKMRIKVRQTKNPTNATSYNGFYAGVATLDSNYVNQTSGVGSHRYFVSTGKRIAESQGWQVFEGVITGEGDASHSNFRPGTAYVKPMFIVNYPSGNGVAQVAYVEFWDATEELENAAEITTEKSARANADSALGQRIDTVSAKTDSTAAKLVQVESALTSKESALAKRISDLSTQVGNKADNSTVTSLNQRIQTAESNINGKASASDLNALKSEVTTKANAARDEAISAMNARGNLLNKYLANWKLGQHPKSLGMGLNGADDENRFVSGIDPYGSTSTIWEMNTNSTRGSDGDGGIGSGVFSCDSKKTYRFSIYAKQTSKNGTVYLGCKLGSGTLNLNGSTNGNPYFFAGDLPSFDKWYLIVGFLRSDDATAESGVSGVYDPDTGKKVANCNEFKIKPGETSQYLRAYWYYSSDPTQKCYFYAPRVDVVDGTEPSLTSLMPSVAVNAIDKAGSLETKLSSEIQKLNTTITTKEKTLAQSITTLSSSVNSKTSKIEQTLSTTANKVGDLESKYSIKVDNDGLVSGFGLLSTANNGVTTSQFGVRADTFFIGSPARANIDKNDNRYPFVTKNGINYLRTAMIEDASITTAKIANIIQSTNYVKGKSGWQLNKSGPSEFNDDVVVNASIKAEKILGDVVSAKIYKTPNSVIKLNRIGTQRGVRKQFLSVNILEPRPYDRTLSVVMNHKIQAVTGGENQKATDIQGQILASYNGTQTRTRVLSLKVREAHKDEVMETLTEVFMRIPANTSGVVTFENYIPYYYSSGFTYAYGVSTVSATSDNGETVVKLFKDGSDLG